MNDTPAEHTNPSLEEIADTLKDFWVRSGGSAEVNPSVLVAMISPAKDEPGQFSVLKVLGTETLPATEMVAYSTQLCVRSLLRLVYESAKEEGNTKSIDLANVLVTIFTLQLEGLGIPNGQMHMMRAVHDIFTEAVTNHVSNMVAGTTQAEIVEP